MVEEFTELGSVFLWYSSYPLARKANWLIVRMPPSVGDYVGSAIYALKFMGFRLYHWIKRYSILAIMNQMVPIEAQNTASHQLFLSKYEPIG